jgi:hypothetical protein
MRSVRVTGVTGTSQAVPLDVYSPARAGAIFSTAGTPALECTFDNVFDTSLTLVWDAVTADADGRYQIPEGARAVRGTGMVGADILIVSQQGIQ